MKKMREKSGEGVRGMCTKNGSYCEKEKKVGGGDGHSRCKWRSEAFVIGEVKFFFVKIQNKKIFFFWGGRVGPGGVRSGVGEGVGVARFWVGG